ncbi:MAG: aspartate aminotransferase family protein [Gammaproteobacteria bacterium]|nr:aspartate aminotransferase family protein [Gammaproteobacteria bacterium]
MKDTQRPPGHLSQDSLDRFRSEGELNISQRRKTWQEQHLDHETREWLAKDAKYFLHQSLSTPCIDVLESCKGSFLEDLQGNRFLDFHGNNVHQVGFGHEHVIAAIRAQMGILSFCPRRYTNKPAIQLAQKLVALAPGNLNKVLLAPGGTNAIGMALKLARMATGRFKTLSMWDAFHGASLDAISVGGEAIFRQGVGPLLPGSEHVPPADPQHCPWGCATTCNLKCAEYVEYVLEKEGDIGAVVAETVRSTPFIPPKGYWKIIREACDRNGALLILDEIPHCLGRTGKMFTCEHYDVVPDMLVIGKGLGGGIFPLAALIAREDLDIAPQRALGHYTHEKNPVACAAALATIEVIEQEGLLNNARELGGYALEKMQAMKHKHAMIGDVRGLGLLMGMELVNSQDTRGRAIDLAEDVMYRCLAKGLSFKLSMGNILTLTPPLSLTQDEMDQALGTLDICLSEANA